MVRFAAVAAGETMICVDAIPARLPGWSALAGIPTMVRLAFEGAPASFAGASFAGAG